MVRNLALGLFCLVLAGCAAGPTLQKSVTDSGLAPSPVVDPALARKYAAEASVALERGEKRKAEEAYRKAFGLDPSDAVSANNLALLLREKGEFQQAVSTLQEGLESSPDTAELHYNLAVIAELYLLDLDLALAHYRRFSELTDQEDEQQSQLVAGWIADLERRLD
jgi:tetratricopeptide (TPR) repeat protein